MLLITSADHRPWHWSLCSTPMGTRHQGGRIFTRAIQNSVAYIRHSWKESKFQIFTFRMHCFATSDTCVPSSECAKMIWEVHFSRVVGHFGVDKIVAILQNYFYLMKICQVVGKYIRSRTACTISKSTIKKQGMYTPLPTPSQPWDMSPWIICRAFLLLSMKMSEFLWSSTNSLRWPS